MQIEVKNSNEGSTSSLTSNEVSPSHVQIETFFWEKQEDLTLRLIQSLPKIWTTLENVFSSQKEVTEFSEFKNLAKTLDCIDWMTITSPNIPDVSTTFISLKKDYLHIPVMLLVQFSCGKLDLDFSENTFLKFIKDTPFDKRAEILSLDHDTSTIQLRFATRYSADEFCVWVSEDHELSQIFQVVANSAKIQLSQDSEPFLPMPTSDMDDDFNHRVHQPLSFDAESKQKAIEKLYHYYNYLIVEQNRDRLYARPEEYQNLDRAVKENQGLQGGGSGKNVLLQMDPDDEFASCALGFKAKSDGIRQNDHPEIKVRYSNDQFLRIFKNLGKFEHPMSLLQDFGINQEDAERTEILSLLTNVKPDIMTEFLKEDIEQRRFKAQISRQEQQMGFIHHELDRNPHFRSDAANQRDNQSFIKHNQPFSVGARLKNPTPAYFRAENMLHELNQEIRLNLK